jgi:hypothetical protein
MPDARRVRARIDGGPLQGGAPRVVWEALDADPRTVSAGSAAHRLDQLGRAGHLVWNPLDGEVVQLIPILRSGRSLGWPGGLHPGDLPAADANASWRPAREAAAKAAAGFIPADAIPAVNAEGRLCVQIGVVAFAWQPFTSHPMTGLQQILDWLDSWGIRRQWPAGRPAPFPDEQAACRSRRLWARGGHFGASQVPGLTATGPGALDLERLTGLGGQGRQHQSGRAGQAPAPGARAPLPGARCADGWPAPAEMCDLHGYVDNDDAAAAARALSRVG